jgi:hypothetical protein
VALAVLLQTAADPGPKADGLSRPDKQAGTAIILMPEACNCCIYIAVQKFTSDFAVPIFSNFS